MNLGGITRGHHITYEISHLMVVEVAFLSPLTSVDDVPQH